MRRETGSVLIVVLWLSVFLSLMAAGMAYGQRVELRITRYTLDRAAAQAVARGGVEKVVAVLANDASVKVHHPKLEWWGTEEKYKNIACGEGKFSIYPDMAASDPEGKGSAEYGLSDEESKININNATEEMFSSFSDISPGLAKAIINRRKELLGESGKSESLVTTIAEAREEKEAEEFPLVNEPFGSLDDLLKVSGMTKKILYGDEGKGGIVGCFTAFSSGKVNVNTVSKEVLKALGVKDKAAQDAIRRQTDGKGFASAKEFMTFTGLMKTGTASDDDGTGGEAVATDNVKEKARLDALKKILAVKSSNFRFVSIGSCRRSSRIAIEARLTVGKEKVLVTGWRVSELARKDDEEAVEGKKDK